MLFNRVNGEYQFNMLRYVSCFLLLIFWTSAQAVEVEIASKRYPIEIDGVKTFLPYESSHNLSSKNDSITRVIYSIHSSSYSAKSYFNRATALVDKVPHQKNKTLIIAPHILDKSCLDRPEDKNILYWEIAAFRGTSRGFFKDKRITVSAFEVTDMILEDVAVSGNFPNLRTIIILGHSAGGQMVNRYAATGIFETKIANPMGIEVRYIVMAPSSYVYFNDERAIEGTVNKFSVPKSPPDNYNRWGYGLERMYAYHKKYKVTPEFVKDRYPSKRILYLVGSKDRNENDPSMGRGAASMLQGKHRLQRAVVYYNYLVHFFGKQIKKTQNFRVVKNAGHSGRSLMLSTPAVKFTFSPNSKQQTINKTANYKLHMFNAITKGVKSLSDEDWAFTAIAPLKPDIVPLFWGDYKAYTGDIRWPQNSYPPVAIASEYQKGRFIALGHDGLLIDPGANDAFTGNILNWLGNGYKHKKVIIYTHMGRWFNKGILTAKAKELLTSRGVEIIELGSQVTDEDLKECDLFIIVRPSQIIEQNEISSIVSYVQQGGSLLMTGMGWFWEAQNKSHDIKVFPLNRLGEDLGFEYSRTSIDKTPPNNKKETRRYSPISFQPLYARKPVTVKNYSLKEHSNSFITHSIALNKDKYHYVVEGEHIILSMPYRFFMKCKKPVEFITQLDAVYELYADLTDGIKPFYGNKIMILNVDNLKFHMSSGNPILSRQDRIVYILAELDKSNYKNPSWGLMHELGHDFIVGMKHYFVFGHGGNESWAEFFALYACQELGLQHKEPTWKETAKAYHESGGHDFERIKNEKWLMIGFLHHILDQYGWDVYKKLFKRYAELIREKNYPDFNDTEKKVDLFVKELSLAAGANFYPYFDRWGFPINRALNEELKHLPRAKLFQNNASNN